MNLLFIALVIASCSALITAKCTKPSLTRFTQNGVRSSGVCAGDLIFEENFDTLDTNRWSHEVSLSGFGNGEFQYYTDDKRVSYTNNGTLHIAPRLLSEDKGEDFMYSGTIDLGSACTNSDDSGCKRTGQQGQVLNPVLSARMKTSSSFSFRYGRVEARLKVPTGDWLWPAFWLLPTASKYGTWPRSGEIDLMESKGNLDMGYPYTATSTLHWGPDASHDLYTKTHFSKGDIAGYANVFHIFQLEWTPEHIAFSVDDHHYGTVTPPSGGFYKLGELTGDNPWAGGELMAPFDQEFHLLINLAVGGTNGYFPDRWGKPWKNGEDRLKAMTEFWEGRQGWQDTWKLDGDVSHLQVDYIKVYAW